MKQLLSKIFTFFENRDKSKDAHVNKLPTKSTSGIIKLTSTSSPVTSSHNNIENNIYKANSGAIDYSLCCA